MPEYRLDAAINYWAEDEADAHEVGKALLENIFVFDDVNSVEAGIPIFVRGDE